MAAQIAFFCAGQTATPAELALIAQINQQVQLPFNLIVLSAVASPAYGAGNVAADYVAGTIPPSYSAVPVYNPASPPSPPLVSTKSIVTNGDSIPVKNSVGSVTKNGTAAVSANAITAVNLIATDSLVSNGTPCSVVNSAGSKTVSGTNVVVAGVNTSTALSATDALVSNNDSVTVKNSSGTVTKTATAAVAAGVISAANLAATEAIVSNAQQLSGVTPSGVYVNKVTFTVAGGVITAIVLG